MCRDDVVDALVAEVLDQHAKSLLGVDVLDRLQVDGAEFFVRDLLLPQIGHGAQQHAHGTPEISAAAVEQQFSEMLWIEQLTSQLVGFVLFHPQFTR